MHGDFQGVERRRGEEERLEIVLSVGVDGASVTQVAHRHDVTRQQICAWRHELQKTGVLSTLPEALFVPVELDRRAELVAQASMTGSVARRTAQIELEPANGRFVRFDPGLEAARLTQLIRAVEGA